MLKGKEFIEDWETTGLGKENLNCVLKSYRVG